MFIPQMPDKPGGERAWRQSKYQRSTMGREITTPTTTTPTTPTLKQTQG
jgi:hypothetical protein